MYSEKIVAERLALAQAEFGFPLDYKSIEEVEAFESRLIREGKYIYDEAGRPKATQNLSVSDARWMQNEQALILCDAAYALTRYCWVKNEKGVIERFHFRVPQRILFEIICDMEERGAPIEIMILKARQLGMSTLVELLVALRIIFSYGVNAVIASADQTKTSEMAKMLFLCYDLLPCWMRPEPTSRVESERGKLLFGQNASGVNFQHGSQKFGIGTGTTPTIYHLSEVALYGDSAIMLIDEGLWKAVHASPSIFGMLESTGRGNTGWWAKTWYYSKKEWPSCRMRPVFLPWYCGVEIYPMPSDMQTHPIPHNWSPDKETHAHAAMAALYVKSNPLLERHLIADQQRRGVYTGESWQLPRNQQWFWEWNHREAKFKGTEASFYQEMAGNDEEALQRSTESAFGHATIQEIDTRRKREYECFTLTGQSIEESHEIAPEYFDRVKERIPVRYVSSKDTYRWELVPLKPTELDEEDPEDADGVLIIFHHPRPGVSYSIGVDTSEGKGQDSTSISVWTTGQRGEPDVQCAEFSSSHVNHVEAFAFILAIAAYYKTHMAQGITRWKEPYVSIEQVQAVGDTAQLQMARMGYSNFHKMPRYDGSPMRIRRQKRGPTAKRGWYTFSYTRAILTGNFVHSAQNGWAEINSPWLIEEMKHWEVKITASGKEKLEHEEDYHDDRIFAAAMAIFCPHDLDVLADRSKKRFVEQTALPPVDVTPYRGQVINSADLHARNTLTLDDVIYQDSRLERLSR